MRAHARNRGLGVLAGELELDVGVELVEAGVAADLGASGPSSRSRACRYRMGSSGVLLPQGLQRDPVL